MIENEMTVSVPLEVVKASEIEPKEVKWLWYPYIPFGKVTLLQGDPGDGKSKLMLSVAALLSKGEPLPFTETDYMKEQKYSYSQRIGKTTFIVNVKQSESAKKPLNTVFQDICKHEVLGDFFTDKSFNLENPQKVS